MTCSHQRRAALVVPAAVCGVSIVPCSSACELPRGSSSSNYGGGAVAPGTSVHGVEMSVFGAGALNDVQVAVAVVEVVTVEWIGEVSGRRALKSDVLRGCFVLQAQICL
jgi:hypothetical protein